MHRTGDFRYRGRLRTRQGWMRCRQCRRQDVSGSAREGHGRNPRRINPGSQCFHSRGLRQRHAQVRRYFEGRHQPRASGYPHLSVALRPAVEGRLKEAVPSACNDERFGVRVLLDLASLYDPNLLCPIVTTAVLGCRAPFRGHRCRPINECSTLSRVGFGVRPEISVIAVWRITARLHYWRSFRSTRPRWSDGRSIWTCNQLRNHRLRPHPLQIPSSAQLDFFAKIMESGVSLLR